MIKEFIIVLSFELNGNIERLYYNGCNFTFRMNDVKKYNDLNELKKDYKKAKKQGKYIIAQKINLSIYECKIEGLTFIKEIL